MKVKAVGFALCSALLFFPCAPWAAFSVNGTQLLDGNGEPFIMRGVNYPHAWYADKTNTAIPDIAATGANIVRVVLSNGTHAEGWTKTSASDVENIIELSKQNNLIVMLEVHDVTGSGDNEDAGEFDDAVAYWLEIQDVLTGEEDYVLINIANEPFGNSVDADTWTEKHVEAIGVLRDAGLMHTIVVDAANWGQDWSNIMSENASTVFDADPLSNTIFSVHMYEVYGGQSIIENYIDGFLADHNVPLIVGEFGPIHNGDDVDEDTILAHAEATGIGYIGWSWSGNGPCCVDLDIVDDFDPNSLTAWGERLINGTNGIAETSITASIFAGAVTPTPEPTPNPGQTPTPAPTPTEVSAPGSSGGGSSDLFLLLATLSMMAVAIRRRSVYSRRHDC